MGVAFGLLSGDNVRASDLDLARVLTALRESLADRLVAVVLFGSRARGDASARSDWDLLVIARGLPDRTFQRRLHLMRMLPSPERGLTSIVARTPAEFEDHLSSLYLDIGLDGIPLYDPQGYAQESLDRLRRIIAQSGISRQRTEDGFVWRWRRGRGNGHLAGWESVGAAAIG